MAPAVTTGDLVIPFFGSLALGLAVYVLLRSFADVFSAEADDEDAEWRYDRTRVQELRRVSLLYRLFQPVIQLLGRFNRRAFGEHLPEIGRQIQAAGLPRFWTAEEYLARLELLTLLAAPVYLYVSMALMGSVGIILAVVATGLTGYALRRRLAYRARYRLFLIKRRLPFLLDLLTLLMEAGSTFLQALSEAVEEFKDHPVGVEFARVLAELSMGKTRTEALDAMRSRLNDDEITSIVGSIIQGEHLGTPLALIFRTQADVLRIKRSQRAETLAGEAGVKMLLPTVLVMAATVIIILGPFILSFIYAEFML